MFTNIHATVSTMNIGRLFHFIDWCFKEKFLHHPNISFDINAVKIPRDMSPLFAPIPNIDEVDIMNKKIKQMFEKSKEALRPTIRLAIERAIVKIDKIIAVQKKKFGSRILAIDITSKQ